MGACLHQRNGTSLTNIVDVTAYSISLFQENEHPKTINKVLVPQSSTSISEPIDVQIDELGNSIITMYQLIGIINDEKVPGLESMLNYMNNHFLAKMNQPSTNTIITLLKNNTTKKHITHTIDKTETYNIENNRYTDEHYYSKKAKCK